MRSPPAAPPPRAYKGRRSYHDRAILATFRLPRAHLRAVALRAIAPVTKLGRINTCRNMPEAPRPLLRNLLTALLFVGGIALLVGLAREIGIEPVVEHADALIWFIPAATLLHILVHWANTLGWRDAIGAEAAKVPFLRLFLVWAAGDLVNWGTPGAVGGEFLRAHLIRDRVPMNVGIASVTVARLAQTMAQFA